MVERMFKMERSGLSARLGVGSSGGGAVASQGAVVVVKVTGREGLLSGSEVEQPNVTGGVPYAGGA
jgi:hypothetical protein